MRLVDLGESMWKRKKHSFKKVAKGTIEEGRQQIAPKDI